MNNQKKETFTRSDIESSLKKEFPELSKSDISDAIDIILDSIIEAVALDDKVEIRGFGTFSLHNHNSRTARNPKTGQLVALEKRYSIHFKPSKELKNRVDNKN